jgi:ubiquinone/menaquinone biosynthesis C-methylase UbiE
VGDEGRGSGKAGSYSYVGRPPRRHRMSESDRNYKRHLSQLYNRAAPTYDRVGPRFFSHFGRHLVELSGLHHGASALDIGCGRGAVLFPAAGRVGGSGSVIGIDLAKTMVEETAREIAHLGLGNAEVRQMDAEKLEFPDSCFDVVFCGFALFLFSDLDRVLREFLRVLKPKGMFLASVFGKKLDQRWDVFRHLVRTYRNHLRPIPQVDTPTLFDVVQLEEILSNAGFVNIEVMDEEKEFRYRDEEEWWATEWSCGNRALFERMEPPALEKFREEALETVRGLKREDGIPVLFHMLLSRASKP